MNNHLKEQEELNPMEMLNLFIYIVVLIGTIAVLFTCVAPQWVDPFLVIPYFAMVTFAKGFNKENFKIFLGIVAILGVISFILWLPISSTIKFIILLAIFVATQIPKFKKVVR